MSCDDSLVNLSGSSWLLFWLEVDSEYSLKKNKKKYLDQLAKVRKSHSSHKNPPNQIPEMRLKDPDQESTNLRQWITWKNPPAPPPKKKKKKKKKKMISNNAQGRWKKPLQGSRITKQPKESF